MWTRRNFFLFSKSKNSFQIGRFDVLKKSLFIYVYLCLDKTFFCALALCPIVGFVAVLWKNFPCFIINYFKNIFLKFQQIERNAQI